MKKSFWIFTIIAAVSLISCKPKVVQKVGEIFKSSSKSVGKGAVKYGDNVLRLIPINSDDD